MFYVRSPAVGGQDAIAEALTVVRQVVPNVTSIYFKDLKQTLKKEHCDVSVYYPWLPIVTHGCPWFPMVTMVTQSNRSLLLIFSSCCLADINDHSKRTQC